MKVLKIFLRILYILICSPVLCIYIIFYTLFSIITLCIGIIVLLIGIIEWLAYEYPLFHLSFGILISPFEKIINYIKTGKFKT